MAMGYETSRENFELMLTQYRDYLNLYADLNGGSTEGATSFAEFYWRLTFYTKYDEGLGPSGRGF